MCPQSQSIPVTEAEYWQVSESKSYWPNMKMSWLTIRIYISQAWPHPPSLPTIPDCSLNCSLLVQSWLLVSRQSHATAMHACSEVESQVAATQGCLVIGCFSSDFWYMESHANVMLVDDRPLPSEKLSLLLTFICILDIRRQCGNRACFCSQTWLDTRHGWMLNRQSTGRQLDCAGDSRASFVVRPDLVTFNSAILCCARGQQWSCDPRTESACLSSEKFLYRVFKDF